MAANTVKSKKTKKSTYMKDENLALQNVVRGLRSLVKSRAAWLKPG